MQLDFLRDPRYSVRNVSDAIMKIPNEYALLSGMGLFPEKGIRTTYVEIEIKEGFLNLIATSERGAPAPEKKRSTRQSRIMKSVFMQQNDTVKPSDLQNLPMFGALGESEQFLEAFDDVLAERFEELQRGYRQTHEYMRWGALHGDVYDADGVRVLYNCYTEMGESQQSIDFKFGTTASDGILAASKAGRRYMEKNLKGETMTRQLALCSSEFFDKVTTHPSYEKFYQNNPVGKPNPFLDDLGVTYFQHGTWTYIEHNGEATYQNEDGTTTTRRFIPENESIVVPLGTRQTFRSYFTPGEMLDAVNMPGQAMYVSLKELDHGKGVEIHTESAPLFLVQKPRLVLRGYSSN
jgi:hypothetical protein